MTKYRNVGYVYRYMKLTSYLYWPNKARPYRNSTNKSTVYNSVTNRNIWQIEIEHRRLFSGIETQAMDFLIFGMISLWLIMLIGLIVIHTFMVQSLFVWVLCFVQSAVLNCNNWNLKYWFRPIYTKFKMLYLSSAYE